MQSIIWNEIKNLNKKLPTIGGSIIDITLKSYKGNPVNGIVVTLTNNGKSISGTTDENGKVKFTGVLDTGSIVVATNNSSFGSYEGEIECYSHYEIIIDDVSSMLDKWFKSAELQNKNFTNINQVFEDKDTLEYLLRKHTSCDFLFSWMKSDETILNAVLSSINAMTAIGEIDYPSYTFLHNEDLSKAICESSNWELVLNNKVPELPSSTNVGATSNSAYSHYLPFKAFDGDNSTYYQPSYDESPEDFYIGYEFEKPMCVKKFRIRLCTQTTNYYFRFGVKASNDGVNWKTFDENIVFFTDTTSDRSANINNDEYFLKYRLFIKESNAPTLGEISKRNLLFYEVQFYGNMMSVSIPTMTSNTQPKGVAISSDIYSSEYAAYKAFDKNNDSYWAAKGRGNKWIGYEFEKDSCIKKLYYKGFAKDATINGYVVEALNEENEWVILKQGNLQCVTTLQSIDVDNNSSYKKYRLKETSLYGTGNTNAVELCMFGFDFAEPVKFLSNWLNAGGVNANSYKSLEEVFADEKLTRKLMTLHASSDIFVDWMTQEKEALDILCSNKIGMKWLGLRDYVCDKMMAIPSISKALLASEHWECILKDHVPVMTSNTAPYGNAFASSEYSSSPAYNVFRGKESGDMWYCNSSATSHANIYVGYEFTNPILCKRLELIADTIIKAMTFKIQGSNDKTNWIDVSEELTLSEQNMIIDISSNVQNFKSYRLLIISETYNNGTNPMYGGRIKFIQFYGRSLNVSVPTMISNTAPWGEVSASSINSSGYQPYRAFDKDITTNWGIVGQQDTERYIQYKFPRQVVAKLLFTHGTPAQSSNFSLQASNDGTNWKNLSSHVDNTNNIHSVNVNNNEPFLYYRLHTDGSAMWATEIQLYGVDYSEREFEEGSTMKYIYDHGVELEEVDKYNLYGTPTGEFNKLENQFFISKTSSANSSNICVVRTNSPINMSEYNLMLVNIGDGYVGSSAAIGCIVSDGTSSSVSYLTNFNSQFDNYTDISNIQGDRYPVVYPSASSTTTGSVYITEWWLE